MSQESPEKKFSKVKEAMSMIELQFLVKVVGSKLLVKVTG
jgi:hypothetical protein